MTNQLMEFNRPLGDGPTWTLRFTSSRLIMSAPEIYGMFGKVKRRLGFVTVGHFRWEWLDSIGVFPAGNHRDYILAISSRERSSPTGPQFYLVAFDGLERDELDTLLTELHRRIQEFWTARGLDWSPAAPLIKRMIDTAHGELTIGDILPNAVQQVPYS